MPYNTKEKRTAYVRTWRDKNRSKISSQAQATRTERRAWALALLGGCCVVCGSTKRLHFDHKDPSAKIDAVANLFRRSETVLRTEIEKCQLLCDQCHRKKTSASDEYANMPAQHGSSQMYFAHKCRCEYCRKWKSDYDKAYKARKQSLLT